MVPLAAVVADDANSDKYVFVYNGQSQKVERRKSCRVYADRQGWRDRNGWLATRRTGCSSAGATRLVDGQQVKVLTD